MTETCPSVDAETARRCDRDADHYGLHRTWLAPGWRLRWGARGTRRLGRMTVRMTYRTWRR